MKFCFEVSDGILFLERVLVVTIVWYNKGMFWNDTVLICNRLIFLVKVVHVVHLLFLES